MDKRNSFIVAGAAITAIALAGCWWVETPTSAEPTVLTVAAPTYADFGQFRRGEPKSVDKVVARLWLPHGRGKVPAVVIAHSIGGWRDTSEGQYVQPLLAAGYAVVGLDHFQGRGITRAADVPGAITPITTASDALVVLRAISTHPRIDASRVGVMGLSLGGYTSELTAYEYVRQKVLGRDSVLRFAAHVPFYGPCSFVISNGADKLMAGGPVLRLLGDLDETTPRASCEAIERRVKQLQPDAVFDTVWYAGAHHAWDVAAFQPARFFPNHVSRRICPVVDFGGPAPVYVLDDGRSRPFNLEEDTACRARSNGYTMGYDEPTAKRGLQDMMGFFARYLKAAS